MGRLPVKSSERIKAWNHAAPSRPDSASDFLGGGIRVWFYLFGRNDRYPDPLAEIDQLAILGERGEDAFLKLSARDDAPLKNAAEGEVIYLCTRDEGRWSILGEAGVIGPPIRGATPPSMVQLYGPVEGRHWWRRLERIRVYESPKTGADLGLEEGDLPSRGQAHVIRVTGRRNGTAAGRPMGEVSSPLDRLTATMDVAWAEGRLTTEAIDAAVSKHRAERPYDR